MDLFDLLAVQGTSLLHHHSPRTSIFWCSAFFVVQLSHPYLTTGKTVAFTRWTFVGEVMSLIFNMLSRLQQYMNCELPNVQAGFRKGRGTREQIANIRWITEKAREFQKNIYFCFFDYRKAFDCVDHNKLWKILKEMGIPGNLTCLLRNLYAGQEATVRTGNGTSD